MTNESQHAPVLDTREELLAAADFLDAVGVVTMSMREQMLLAISEVHSGNAEEANRIVDAVIDALAKPTPEFIQDISGYFMIRLSQLPFVWRGIVKSIKAGK